MRTTEDIRPAERALRQVLVTHLARHARPGVRWRAERMLADPTADFPVPFRIGQQRFCDPETLGAFIRRKAAAATQVVEGQSVRILDAAALLVADTPR